MSDPKTRKHLINYPTEHPLDQVPSEHQMPSTPKPPHVTRRERWSLWRHGFRRQGDLRWTGATYHSLVVITCASDDTGRYWNVEYSYLKETTVGVGVHGFSDLFVALAWVRGTL